MNITDYLIQKGGLVKKQEVSDQSGHYSMVDDGGVELEVGEFLYGLVRVLQPENVLTTGIYTGVSDMYIAQGLMDNSHGKSTAIEYEKFHVDRAITLWNKVGVIEVITPVLMSSLEFEPKEHYQFMFLDTEINLRLHELVKYFPYLDEGG